MTARQAFTQAIHEMSQGHRVRLGADKGVWYCEVLK